MNILEYIESVKERLLTDPVVVAFEFLREHTTHTDAYLRVRLELADESRLEVSEYAQHLPEGIIEVVTYSYHWTNDTGNLILRWDNTPHFPGMPGFPHHIHKGQTDEVRPGKPANLFAILDEIKVQIKSG